MSKISHCLWFNGQAEDAANFYVSVFKNGKVGKISRYPQEGFEIHKHKAGTVMTVDFSIDGQKYLALNGGPEFKFNEAFSIVVNCETQSEIDSYWNSLTAGGGQESVCGWLKDKFGVSWQIVPMEMEKLMSDPDQKKTDRVFAAMMKMKKLDIGELKRAYEGKA